MGYFQAGFQEIVGVDIQPQPRYPFEFVLGDALEYAAKHGHEFDVIHASPPCQAYSVTKGLSKGAHPELVPATRDVLRATGKFYVLENVPGAPLDIGLMLCGSMFGLQTSCGAQLRRHRLFESNALILSPGPCLHGGDAVISVAGHDYHNPARRHQRRKTITITGSTPQRQIVRNFSRETFSVQEARRAMGIPWMTMAELSQSIPPAYTKWIGMHLINHITRCAELDARDQAPEGA